MIRKLGGKIVDSIGAASRVVFTPSQKPLPESEFYKISLAAVSGKRLLPSNYVLYSGILKRFEDVRGQLITFLNFSF